MNPLYRGTWFPTPRRPSPSQLVEGVSIRYIAVLGFQPEIQFICNMSALKVSIRYIAVLGFQPFVVDGRDQTPWMKFPSAISRYLVSNMLFPILSGRSFIRFHPLYRGTWFPTIFQMATEGAPYYSCFHPLYRGTWFPTCAEQRIENGNAFCFHPLYRGTWFPTVAVDGSDGDIAQVSIRYIAVLGFQPN